VDRFTGKVAVVTGGASGIGAATARLLAHEGARVTVVDMEPTGLRAVADEIGGRAVVLDVADATAWDGLVARLEDEDGGIDLAHLNAGVVTRPHPYRLVDVTEAQYRRIIGVNVDGVVRAVLTLLPVMQRRGGGSIVATASLAGITAYPPDPIYAATKSAVVGFVRAAAPQLGEIGIGLHVICPGAVETGLITEEVRARIAREGRGILEAAEVADAVVEMFASDEVGLVRMILAGRGAEDYRFRGVPASPPP
jgi:NAD(P)-dependent dehydrogenase (short-subunit alcohol dehydrogenase family)